MKLYIGLMSGTSMDGIDAALVDLTTNTLVTGITCSYSEETRTFLRAVLSGEITGMAALCQLNHLIGKEFAFAVQQLLETAMITPQQVIAIGSHGQTIAHDATANIPYTLQLGCAHTIAELTGITVVADFRTRDLVVGGRGAPFAPIYHQVLFGQMDYPCVIVNIGGIANVTFLNAGGSCGYDTGPGNCLMDMWVQRHLGYSYDEAGRWGATGQVVKPLLTALLADPYFKRLPPKSIGKEYFSDSWLLNYLGSDYTKQDVQATLLMLTATTISQAVKAADKQPKRLMICGGGAHNTALCLELARLLPDLIVDSTQSVGIDPDFIEAMMFAWLAEKTLSQISLDLSGITGANKPVILGAVYYSSQAKG
ncbi:anhydro-N-acetylmuramic acid kinase [Legionella nagasakiensis]|uniref:anhydro-N-acetylmuramic acid kinase n=1 Tax=Legionella nagasakiensis TaxID=535290 RepID=UPI001054C77A|nr:anhydro-N-acetylmuramic acid kinase [Legionella nagasakiensis]